MAERCRVNLQWKNTDACFDFWCPCGWEGEEIPTADAPTNHEDGFFKQEFRCAGCGRWWHLSNVAYAAPGKFFHEDTPPTYGCGACEAAHADHSGG